MTNRIKGFDLARTYAIFGMYVVNFAFCFGSFRGDTFLHYCMGLFVGNSTSIFIICAGMGLVLMTNQADATVEDKAKLRSVVMKRSWFLFALGLLLYPWWQGDILHFYGGYMHIAAFMLFVPKQNYLWAAFFAIVGYNILQFFVPITAAWNLAEYRYLDFWTPLGFLRNTIYNGWNSMFPWFAYFALGMWLAHLNWNDFKVQKRVFTFGFFLLATFKVLRIFIRYDWNNPLRHGFYERNVLQLLEDYFPANIPFLMITTGWALMVISFCMYLGNRFSESKIVNILTKTGQMTLSNYVLHTTLGMILLSILTHKTYTGFPQMESPIEPIFVFIYAFSFFIFSVAFSYFWKKRFKNGPLEMLMRKISG